MKAPDLIEPVVGWRTWIVEGGDVPLLRSPQRETQVWAPGRAFSAVCLAVPNLTKPEGRGWRRSHLPPIESCTCGVYATKSKEPSYASATNIKPVPWVAALGVRSLVYGQVALWGTVVEHQDGYRGEYAYPRRIIVPHMFRSYLLEPDGRYIRRLSADEAADELARSYQVDVTVSDAVWRFDSRGTPQRPRPTRSSPGRSLRHDGA